VSQGIFIDFGKEGKLNGLWDLGGKTTIKGDLQCLIAGVRLKNKVLFGDAS